MTPKKETTKALITDLKEMAIYEQSDFRIILFKVYSTAIRHRKLKIRKMMYKQNKKFNTEIETIKKTVELKNTMTELKNSTELQKETQGSWLARR